MARSGVIFLSLIAMSCVLHMTASQLTGGGPTFTKTSGKRSSMKYVSNTQLFERAEWETQSFRFSSYKSQWWTSQFGPNINIPKVKDFEVGLMNSKGLLLWDRRSLSSISCSCFYYSRVVFLS